MNWQLNKIQFPVYNLGEGKRIGIWVQGCTIGCKGCINKTLWPSTGGQSIPVAALFNWLLLHQEGYDGITISGGEPFQQYPQLIAFLHLVKTRTHLTVHCFTGFTLEVLEEMYPDKLFLTYIDVLVDGPYQAALHEEDGHRGSSNQRIFTIPDGQPQLITPAPASTRYWSIQVDADQTVYMAGIPGKQDLNRLSTRIQVRGKPLKFL